MTPDTSNWDKGKFYLSKNHSEVWIYIPPPIGEWRQFFSQSTVTQLVDAGITAFQSLQLQKDKK